MTVLVLETGSGANPAANCYCLQVDVDQYFSDRGNSAWTGNATVKEAAILAAADYLDAAYVWKGVRLSDSQPMQWPRDTMGLDPAALSSSLLVNVVPPEVKRANIELALRALTGSLWPDQTGGKVISESKSIAGAISKSKTYDKGSDATARRFPMIDGILRRLIAGGGGTGVVGQRIERA